jgi:hypothetical protein
MCNNASLGPLAVCGGPYSPQAVASDLALTGSVERGCLARGKTGYLAFVNELSGKRNRPVLLSPMSASKRIADPSLTSRQVRMCRFCCKSRL